MRPAVTGVISHIWFQIDGSPRETEDEEKKPTQTDKIKNILFERGKEAEAEAGI